MAPDRMIADAMPRDAALDASGNADRGRPDRGPDLRVEDADRPDAALPDATPADLEVVADMGVDANAQDCLHRDLCNGRDDDCDGRVDEGIAPGECARGIGACARDGALICRGGVTVCTAEPGAPAAERCSGLDEDCDGRVDEDFALGQACRVGVGACQRAGVAICEDDGTAGCSVAPGVPAAETCNGVDEDCDGIIDEVPPRLCERGLGACRREAQLVCQGRRAVCLAEIVRGGPELCGNAVDDDCDGRVDEQPAEPCVVEVGTCRVGQPWACGADGWRCANDDLPVPPECAIPECPQPDVIDLGRASIGDWTVLAPTAEAPRWEVVIRGPGGAQLWTLGVAGLVGPPRALPGSVTHVVRRGAAYAGVETDGRGWRWVALDAAGQVERRAPHFYEVVGEPSVFAELHSVGMAAVEGGYQVVFNVGKPGGLAMFGMRLDAAGAPGEAHEAGYTVRGGVLRATPAGPVVLAATYNGIGWRGPQLPQLPNVSAVARIDDRGRIGGPGGRRAISRLNMVVPTDLGHVQLWRADRTYIGTAAEAYPLGRAPGPIAGIWQGEHLLMAWIEDSPVGRGIRAQARSRTGVPLAPPFWLMVDLPPVRGLALYVIDDTVLTVWWGEDGGRHMRRGTEPVACGELLCAPGEWPVTPDGLCQGLPACVATDACERDQPVCGCDGVDYPDRCAATARGVGVWRAGRCREIDEGPCIFDINSDAPQACLPCTAYAPVCVWLAGQFQDEGRRFSTLCDALREMPEGGWDWTEGACQTPAQPLGCDPQLCDQACPICGIDDQCYSARDLYDDCIFGF